MPKTLSVSQLNNYIKGVFLDEILLHNIEVFGEITEFNISGGNTFITVREGDCVLPCIKFGLHENLPIGMKVLLSGAVTFYEKGGRVSFNVRVIKPYGEGEDFLRLKKLKERLCAEGLFENRPELPPKISSVAVVTSASGAVIHDILGILKDRIKIDVYIFDVRVQGEDAEKEIASAVKTINSLNNVDCIIIARGGGAFVDLNVFNAESVARAVAQSAIPIISAVGHETDYTLCDLCAGVRAGTPSIAAELVASVNDALYARIEHCIRNMNKAVSDKLIGAERRLYRTCHFISVTSERRIMSSYNAVKRISERMSAIIDTKLESAQSDVLRSVKAVNDNIEKLAEDKSRRYGETDKKLEMLSPLKILSKGYARIKKQGKNIFKAAEISESDEISIVMSDGVLGAKVKNKKML